MDNNENVELEQAQATPEQPQNDNVDNQQAEAPKSFSQEEVDKIVTDRVNRALKKAEKEAKAKADEAEKLRSMNAEQKAKYEAEKKDAEIARLTAQLNRQGMEKEASKMLAESGITANDSILAYVVRDDAEQTQSAVQEFSALVEAASEAKARTMLAGKTPKREEHAKDISMADLANMTPDQINQNWDAIKSSLSN